MELVGQARPDQVTLVPDSVDQLTSDHGWQVPASMDTLGPALEKIRAAGSRGAPVSGSRYCPGGGRSGKRL